MEIPNHNKTNNVHFYFSATKIYFMCTLWEQVDNYVWVWEDEQGCRMIALASLFILIIHPAFGHAMSRITVSLNSLYKYNE